MSETMMNQWAAIMSDYLKAMSAIEQRFQSGNEIPVPDARITRAEWEALDRYSLEDEARSTDAGMAYMHLEAERDALRAEVERLRASQQWQPIETLPPMEVPVWLYEDGHIYIGMRADSGEGWLWSKCYSIPWYNAKDGWTEGDPEEDDDYQPTLWMPLPEPPAERGEG